MDKVLEWVSQNRIIVGIATISLAFGVYNYKQQRIAWRRKPLPQPPTSNKPSTLSSSGGALQKLRSQNSEHSSFRDQLQLLSSVQQVFDKQNQITRAVEMIEIIDYQSLSFEEVRAIYIYSLNIIKDEYEKFTREVRKRRRLIRKINQDQYLNILLDYDNKISQLLERGREELVEALGIQPEVYYDGIFQIQQGECRTEFFLLEQSMGRRLKQKMLRRRRLSDKTATEILEYQLSFLKNQLYQRYQSILKGRQITETQVVNAIQTIIEDLIYQKYGYQQQHMIIKLSDSVFSQRQQITHLTQQIQLQNQKLLGQLAGFKTAMQTIDYD